MIKLITAMDVNGLIGNGPFLPWSIPEEMKVFRKLTTNNTVVMGSTTFESIGKPLPNRHNVVITRDAKKYAGQDVEICTDIDEFLKLNSDFFVIGGLQVYNQFISRGVVEKYIVSHIIYEYAGDIFFPKEVLKGLKQNIIHEGDAFTTKEYTR